MQKAANVRTEGPEIMGVLGQIMYQAADEEVGKLPFAKLSCRLHSLGGIRGLGRGGVLLPFRI